MRCTLRSKAKSHVSAEATQRGTSRCMLLLRVPSNRQRTSAGRITLSARCSSPRVATRFLFFIWSLLPRLEMANKQQRSSLTNRDIGQRAPHLPQTYDRSSSLLQRRRSWRINASIFCISSRLTTGDRIRRNLVHSAAISIPVREDRHFEASADFRAENGRLGFSLVLKRESSERGIFWNIARVSFDR